MKKTQIKMKGNKAHRHQTQRLRDHADKLKKGKMNLGDNYRKVQKWKRAYHTQRHRNRK